jgi:hypothetical protein
MHKTTPLVSHYHRQMQGKTIHSPTNRLPAAGWEIVSGGRETVTASGLSRVNVIEINGVLPAKTRRA